MLLCLRHIGSFLRRYSIVSMLWGGFFCCLTEIYAIDDVDCDHPIFTFPADTLRETAPENQCFYTVDGLEFDPVFSCTPNSGFSVTHNFNGNINSNSTLDGAEIPVGIHTITWTLKYDENVIQTMPVTVIIKSLQPPVITSGCPRPEYPNSENYFPADPGQCTATKTFTAPISSSCYSTPDTLYWVVYSERKQIGNGKGNITFAFPIGRSAVIYTSKDETGSESAPCRFTVFVQDDQPPNAVCKTEIPPVILDAQTGTASISVDDIDGGSWDNCMIINRSLDILDFNCQNLGPNTVTLTVEDKAGNTDKCTATVNVVYDTSLNPEAFFQEREICSGDKAYLELTHPDFASWDWNVSLLSGKTTHIEESKSDESGKYTIVDAFINDDDAVDSVTYTITPTIIYRRYNQCTLQPVERKLWVNPQPKLLDIADATICNKTETPISVQTSSKVSRSAAVYFRWETFGNPDDVLGFSVSGIEQVKRIPPLTQIKETLTNQTQFDKEVKYILHPLLRLNGKECPSDDKFKKEVTITVMPTPVIDVTVCNATICSGQTINFTVSSPNELSKGIWKSELLPPEMEAGISITQPAPSSLPINGTFKQTITNRMNNGLTVKYTFIPQIEMVQNGRYCYAPEKNVTLPVRVNPVPKITAQIPHHPQLCYNAGAQIDLESPTNNIFGSLNYNLYIDYAAGKVLNVIDPALSVNFTQQTATIIQPAFQNESDIAQTVTYKIYPFIHINSSLQCRGDSIIMSVHQAPKLTFNMVADTVYGGYNIRCYGETNGKISIKNTSGGWAANGYDYKWSANINAGNNTTVISNLPADNYSITVSDKVIGCTGYNEITLKQPGKLILLPPGIIRPDCKYSDGTITIFATGGTNSNIYPYKYKWVADGLFEYFGEINSFSNLKTGEYTITVIDTNQCKVSTKYDLPYISDVGSFNMGNWRAIYYGPDQDNEYYTISCYGANDGVLNPNPSGKKASAYTWKYNGEVFKENTAPSGTYFTALSSDFRITNLKPGVYELTIIDNSGCEFVSDTFVITQPSPITFNELIPKYENNYEVQCFGDKNGSIIISDVAGAFGGTYEYWWNKTDSDMSDIVQRASKQTTLGAGTYELTIINKFNCKTTATYLLTEPPELIVKETIPKKNGYEIQCYGEQTGSISLNVSGGGEGKYDYQWNTSDGSGLKPQNQNQNGLSSGTYTVDIGYSNGLCVKTKQYEIKAPPRIVNDSIVSSLKCFGDNNASININITGGVPSYSYLWSSTDGIVSDPGAQNQSNLAPGIYQLKITDANDCIKQETYTLTSPDPLNPNLEAEDMSCLPGNDGYIIARTSGGTPGYTYKWSQGSTIDEITGLLPGTYSVTVTDANGCISTASADIRIPLPLQVTAVIESDYNNYHIDCYANNTGKIALNIQHGRGGYIYQWSSGDDTERIDHAIAGDYSVTVTDRFNCAGTASTTLIQPDPLWGKVSISDVTCPGDNTGSIMTQVAGGVAPYRYRWSNAAENTHYVDRLTAGTYQVQITDKNQCILDLQATITQPPKFTVDFMLTDAFCPETSDGDIRSVVSGGTPPYTYQWKDIPWGTSPNIADLRSGVYSLEVTDAMYCKYIKPVELGYTNAECVKIFNAFSPNNDGFNDYWEIFVGDPNSSSHYHLRDVYPDAIVEVYSSRWGKLLYRSQKGYPEPWDGKFQGKYLPTDSYVYRIILNNNTKPITGNVHILR